MPHSEQKKHGKQLRMRQQNEPLQAMSIVYVRKNMRQGIQMKLRCEQATSDACMPSQDPHERLVLADRSWAFTKQNFSNMHNVYTSEESKASIQSRAASTEILCMLFLRASLQMCSASALGPIFSPILGERHQSGPKGEAEIKACRKDTRWKSNETGCRDLCTTQKQTAKGNLYWSPSAQPLGCKDP